MQRKPLCASTKLALFAVSKDKWNTKEDTGKFMKNILYIRSKVTFERIRNAFKTHPRLVRDAFEMHAGHVRD